MEHTMVAHEGIRYQCNECPKSYTTRFQLNWHMKKEHFNACLVCNVLFEDKEKLAEHNLNNHKEDGYECQFLISKEASIMASKIKRLSLEDRQAICEESFKPLIQPCDAGIIKCLKAHYRRFLFQRINSCMEVDTKWLDSLKSVKTHYIKENQAKKQSQPRIKNFFTRNNNGNTQD